MSTYEWIRIGISVLILVALVAHVIVDSVDRSGMLERIRGLERNMATSAGTYKTIKEAVDGVREEIKTKELVAKFREEGFSPRTEHNYSGYKTTVYDKENNRVCDATGSTKTGAMEYALAEAVRVREYTKREIERACGEKKPVDTADVSC